MRARVCVLLTDHEEHDGDLRDGEEAPDGRLLHEVGRDEAGQVGAEREEEHSLDHHAALLVEGKEGREHAEGVDGGAGDDVRRVGHRDRPGKVPLAAGEKK